jgi:pyruvate kinase
MSIDTEVQLLRSRRTKIVATLGPASRDPETIAELIEAGVNVFRLNMSHGTHDSHGETFGHIRKAAANAGRSVAILADLAGPKIRVGKFRDGEVMLEAGARVVVTTREVLGEPGLIPSQYNALASDVRAGDRILLADGVMELRVERVDGTEITCAVIQGGLLTDRKGINLPNVSVSAPCLMKKDRADAKFLLGLGVDFLGLSFVRCGEDVAELKSLIEEAGAHADIIAKIERPEALRESESIIDGADGIMVARGDLGIELPPEQVPIAQLKLIYHAKRKNKPVIVATQMLESMMDNPRPTRAEVADVSQAVFGGADAIMLSGETASGAHPVASVKMMDRIARHTEGHLWEQGAFGVLGAEPVTPPIPFGDAVARSMALLSRDLRVRAIVVISGSGMSAATMSAARPAAPIISISPTQATCRRMSLMWGVIPYFADNTDLSDGNAVAKRLAGEIGLASEGEFILLVRGFHAEPERNAPSITLLQV